jgi:hypothetical protein
MKNCDTTEKSYEALAIAALDFPKGRSWDCVHGKYVLLKGMISAEWSIVSGGVVDETGAAPTKNLRDSSMDAALFLRDDFLRTTGDRIWGLTFTLFPTGKFKIEYDYNKPEGYEETDETISIGDALSSLQAIVGSDKPKD